MEGDGGVRVVGMVILAGLVGFTLLCVVAVGWVL